MPIEKATRIWADITEANQERLRLETKKLANENRHIKSEKERAKFLNLYRRALWGVDGNEKKYPFSAIVNGQKISFMHIGQATYRISEWDGKNDSKLNGLEPREVWGALLHHYFVVFSPAFHYATGISSEKIEWTDQRPRGAERGFRRS